MDGHEQYYDLPNGEKGKSRPFHLPNAAIRSGDMCLVEFGQTSHEGDNVAIAFGFTTASVSVLRTLCMITYITPQL